jgi:hypothetical protein
MMRIFLPILVALALAAPAMAECAKPEALARFAGKQPFVQTRTLKGMSRPLKSTGEVEVTKDSAIWRVLTPMAITTRISPAGITQSVDGGPEQPMGPSAGANPFLNETGLLDLLKGDLSRMDARYEVAREARAKPEGWKLNLKPKSAQLSPYVSAVRVEGCKRVEAIAVDQANGDSIRIELTGAPGGSGG